MIDIGDMDDAESRSPVTSLTDADLDRMERETKELFAVSDNSDSWYNDLEDKLTLITALREARAEVERLNSDKYNLQQGIEDMEHSCCIRDGRPVVIQNAIEGNAVRLRYRCSHCMITWDVTKGRHGPDYFHDKEDTDG